MKYIQIDGDEAAKLGYPEAEEHTSRRWDMSDTCIYFVDGDRVEFVGADGGEPEDQTLYRDFSWVIDALNEAFERGRASK